jgi:hypothetical protein
MNIEIKNDSDYKELFNIMRSQVHQAFGKATPNTTYKDSIRSVMMRSPFLRAGAVALIAYLDKAGEAPDGQLAKLTPEQVQWINHQSVVLKDTFGITEGIDY